MSTRCLSLSLVEYMYCLAMRSLLLHWYISSALTISPASFGIGVRLVSMPCEHYMWLIDMCLFLKEYFSCDLITSAVSLISYWSRIREIPYFHCWKFVPLNLSIWLISRGLNTPSISLYQFSGVWAHNLLIYSEENLTICTLSHFTICIGDTIYIQQVLTIIWWWGTVEYWTKKKGARLYSIKLLHEVNRERIQRTKVRDGGKAMDAKQHPACAWVSATWDTARVATTSMSLLQHFLSSETWIFE